MKFRCSMPNQNIRIEGLKVPYLPSSVELEFQSLLCLEGFLRVVQTVVRFAVVRS